MAKPRHPVQEAYLAYSTDSTPTNLDALYRAVYEQSLAVLFKLLHMNVPELATNATSSALSKLSTFRHRSRFATWSHRIAYNEGLMYLRRHREQVIENAQFDLLSGPRTQNEVESRLRLAQIEKSLKGHDLALFKFYRSNMSAQDIAGELRVSRKHVERQWAQLCAKIRRRHG